MARINSRQVEAFRAMMLTGSVTEAAKLMAVTQPAVSRLLRDFQALLKMELFERRGSGLVPTAAATALYMEVERSFVGLERITRPPRKSAVAAPARCGSPPCRHYPTATCPGSQVVS